MDLGNVAVYLRTDERSLAAHVGVIGKLGMTRERQLPCIKDHQYPDTPIAAAVKMDTTRTFLRVLACSLAASC